MTTPIDDEPAERLAEDDQAARASELFLATALLEQQRVARKPGSTPGVCTNCGEPCLPRAVYCDAACRADHERRVKRGAA